MKSILLTVAIGALMWGCTVETFEKPPKTILEREAIQAITSEIGVGVSMADIALKLNLWHRESDPVKKNRLEDQYFPNNKLRVEGDTIVVLGFGKARTYNQDLTAQGSKWDLMFFPSDRIPKELDEISCTGDKSWEIERAIRVDPYDPLPNADYFDAVYYSCIFTLSTAYGDGVYSINGAGMMYYAPNFEKVDYKVAKPYIFAVSGGNSIGYQLSEHNLLGGAIEVDGYTDTFNNVKVRFTGEYKSPQLRVKVGEVSNIYNYKSGYGYE